MRKVSFISTWLVAFVLSSSLGQACDKLVDQSEVQLLELASSDVGHSNALKRNVPHCSAVGKALRQVGLLEQLDSQYPEKKSDANTFKSLSAIIKVTKYKKGSVAEAHRLNALKASAHIKPFAGLRVVFPKAILMPYGANTGVSDDPSHIYILPRVAASKTMKAIILDAMVQATSADLSMIYSFGYRLGQFQASSLRKASGEYVSDTHFRLLHENIVPTKLWAFGSLGEFAVYENANIIRGHEYRPCPISVDPLFFLFRSMALGIMDAKFTGLIPSKQKDQMKAFIACFFHGYILAFDDQVASDLRRLFTSKICIMSLASHSKYVVPMLPFHGKVDDFYDEILFPAIDSAFSVHEIPANRPYTFPNFYPENLRHPGLQAIEGKAPKGFDAASYCEFYSEFVRDAPKFMMHPRKFALFQYLNWGRPAGLIYFDAPVVVPENFNAEAYLEMYPDVAASAGKFFMNPISFAKFHYFKWGKQPWGKEKSRLALFQPLDLPKDFNPHRYVEKWPQLKAEAERFNIPLLVYAKVQYTLWGKAVGQAYK